MDEFNLTAEQEAEAARIEDVLRASAAVEVKRIAWLLASKPNRQLRGETEFQIRDAVHRLGRGRLVPLCSSGKKRGGGAAGRA